jgi:hypothetical protein
MSRPRRVTRGSGCTLMRQMMMQIGRSSGLLA